MILVKRERIRTKGPTQCHIRGTKGLTLTNMLPRTRQPTQFELLTRMYYRPSIVELRHHPNRMRIVTTGMRPNMRRNMGTPTLCHTRHVNNGINRNLLIRQYLRVLILGICYRQRLRHLTDGRLTRRNGFYIDFFHISHLTMMMRTANSTRPLTLTMVALGNKIGMQLTKHIFYTITRHPRRRAKSGTTNFSLIPISSPLPTKGIRSERRNVDPFFSY